MGVAYFVIADPLNLRPIIMSLYDKTDQVENPTTATGTEAGVKTSPSPTGTGHVSPTQAEALESIGLSPTSVPTTFTPEQIACFVGILGQARVDAIVAGDTPTPTEFFKAKSCL